MAIATLFAGCSNSAADTETVVEVVEPRTKADYIADFTQTYCHRMPPKRVNEAYDDALRAIDRARDPYDETAYRSAVKSYNVAIDGVYDADRKTFRRLKAVEPAPSYNTQAFFRQMDRLQAQRRQLIKLNKSHINDPYNEKTVEAINSLNSKMNKGFEKRDQLFKRLFFKGKCPADTPVGKRQRRDATN